MNSLYDLCEYGLTINEVNKLKMDGISVSDIRFGSENYKNNKYFKKARNIYNKNNYIFEIDSVFELHEYGISSAIIESIRNKVTIRDLKNNSDEELYINHNIKYSTLNKIRKCGYFPNSINDIDNDLIKDNEKEIYELRNYGVSQTVVNTIIKYRDLKLTDILDMEIDEIATRFKLSKATAEKVFNCFERYKKTNNIKTSLNKLIPKYLQEKTKYHFISFDTIIDNYHDYEVEEVKNTIDALICNDIIIEENSLYRYNYVKIEDAIREIRKEKLRNMVELKLKGNTLQEIGNRYGLTRERVRQIVSKFIQANVFYEDIYKDFIEKYNFSENEFIIIFDSNKISYEYLRYKYELGDEEIEDFIEEHPEYLSEEKSEKLLALNDEVLYRNCKIKLNYTEMLRIFVRSLDHKKDLRQILQEVNNDFYLYGLQPLNERNLEARLGRIDNIINGIGKKYKYYDFSLISDNNLTTIQNMIEKLSNGYYSTLKIYKDNKSFFNEIGIEDEYEVHNLLRKIFSDKIDKISFSVMPSFFIGDIEIEQFFLDLIKKYEPINLNDFVKLVEKKYGHKEAQIRQILKRYFDKYINIDEINIKQKELSIDDIDFIKTKMTKNIYNTESFYKLLQQKFPNDYLEYVNGENLNRLRLSFCREICT